MNKKNNNAVPNRIIRAKNGDYNLAKAADRKRLKKVVVDLVRDSDRLAEHDIANWRYACQRAIDIDYPNRQLLYDIYNDVDLDLHLSGGIGQVNGFVKARSFKLTNDKGDTDPEAAKYFNRTWFKDLLDYIRLLGALAHRARQHHTGRKRQPHLRRREAHPPQACGARISSHNKDRRRRLA